MEHTPTPWKVSERDWYIISNRGHICEMMGPFGYEVNKANARRIVACVNACEGIPTEAIEGRRINDILLEKNRLLEALNRILAFNLESDGATEDWVELVATIRNARNVIAEAEKTPTP